MFLPPYVFHCLLNGILHHLDLLALMGTSWCPFPVSSAGWVLWGHGREPDGLAEIFKVTVSVSMTPHTAGEPSQACPLATRPCLNRTRPMSCFIHSLNKAPASAAQIWECLAFSVFIPSIYACCNLCKLQFVSFCMWLVITTAKDTNLGKCVVHMHAVCCVYAFLHILYVCENWSGMIYKILSLLQGVWSQTHQRTMLSDKLYYRSNKRIKLHQITCLGKLLK